MFKYTISKADKDLSGEVTLFPNKSISNKVLLFRVIKQSSDDQRVVSKEEDEAKLIFEKVPRIKKNLDKGDAGAAIRHLRSFFHFFKGDWLITGTDNARNHPIKTVVKLLKQEGVNIEFVEREGFPPFKLIGKNFSGNTILRVDSSITSQVVSASLIVSPSLPNSVILEMKDRIINSSYIELTLKALQYIGINSGWEKSETLIESEFKDGSELTVEADWADASYWYEAAALSSKCNLTIKGLNYESSQCDIVTKELFYQFGVKTRFIQNGVILSKGKQTIKSFEYNFANNLELVPTFVVLCVIQKIPFRIKGIKELHFKCNDRLKSLLSELLKFGAKVTIEASDDQETLCFDGKSRLPKKPIEILTYDDHRMVMAFAPLAILGIPIIIENPKLTSKSYPSFWDDFKKTGFTFDQE